MNFIDRKEAGKKLGNALSDYTGTKCVVLALPRGGVAVAAEVAKILKAPLETVLVRKIGHPANPEYAIGAVAEGERPVYNPAEFAYTDPEWRKRAESKARQLMLTRRKLYDGGPTSQTLAGTQAIIVDDGIATGLTMKVAVMSTRKKQPAGIVIAVPVASPESVTMLRPLVNDIVLLDKPERFMGAVGSHYENFTQVTDQQVIELLKEARHDLYAKTAES